MKTKSDNTTPPGLENIKRIVVLMFENRSFDHLFGDFPNVNGLMQGDSGDSVNPAYYNLIHPLKPESTANCPIYPIPIDPSVPQSHDFTHDFGDGMMPDLFGPVFTINGDCASGTYQSGYVNGNLYGAQNPLPKTYPATNSGFASTVNSCSQQGQTAMTYFEYGVPKVLHKLAEEFVLCDNWYCDMPGHTLPNRAFIHCGTTHGAGIADTDLGMVNATSIFDQISKYCPNENLNWKMYTPVDAAGNLGQLDTRFLNENLTKYSGYPITDFTRDCNNDSLPFYSFIMCWLPSSNTYTDTSMHPNSLIQPGENLLAAVYNTLRNSPCWEDTLLAVTFDENGGLYDHVFPPTTTPPVPGAAPTTQYTQGCCGNKWFLDSKFDFSLLGLRVPAILISPWLKKGIDSSPYQNTSVLRFIIDQMNEQYNVQAPYLTQRDANAPSLNSVFSKHGQSTKRHDCPSRIEHYATLPTIDPITKSNLIPYNDGTLTAWIPPTGMAEALPVPYIDELLNIYVSPLPGHPDSNKKMTRTFATNGEVQQYIDERNNAAAAYYKSDKCNGS